MDGTDMTEGPKPPRRARRLAATGLVVSGLLAGGVLGSQVANAASSSPTSSASTSAGSAATNAGVDPTTMRHGPGETLLTDGTASKVKAAALAAVPGGAVIRVETDSAGSPYEAHVQKSDGKHRHREDRRLLQRDEHRVGLRLRRTDVGERIQRLIAILKTRRAEGPRRNAGPLGNPASQVAARLPP
jgi:hypothetical protein